MCLGFKIMYKGYTLIPMGYVPVKVEYKKKFTALNFSFVKQDMDTILGHESLYKIIHAWDIINTLNTSTKVDINKLLEEYKEVFENQIGEINKCVVVELKLGLEPKFYILMRVKNF